MANYDNQQYIVIKKPTKRLSNSKSILQNQNGEHLSFSNNLPSEKPLFIKNGASLSRLMPAPAYISQIRIIKTDPERLANPIKMLNFSEIKNEPSSQETLICSFRERKRARLDNLTTDQKLMRRKLKNRTAAQVSRDKRRRYVVEMEEMIKQLQEENSKVIQLNNKLIDKNDNLEKLNKELVQKNLHLYSSLDTQSPAQIDPTIPANNLNQIYQQNKEIVQVESLMNINETMPEAPKVEKEDNMNIDLFDLAADSLNFSLDDYESDTDSGVNMDFDDISTQSSDWDKNLIDELFPDLCAF